MWSVYITKKVLHEASDQAKQLLTDTHPLVNTGDSSRPSETRSITETAFTVETITKNRFLTTMSAALSCVDKRCLLLCDDVIEFGEQGAWTVR